MLYIYVAMLFLQACVPYNLECAENPVVFANDNASDCGFEGEREKVTWPELLAQSSHAIFQIINYQRIPSFAEPYRSPEVQGVLGTGFCVSEDGFVITNYHVVEMASCLYAQHPCLSKEKFKIDIVGVDPDIDIALLKFPDEVVDIICEKMGVNKMPSVVFGDSRKLLEGEKLLVVGYPLGMEEIKGTCGIFSGMQALKDDGLELVQTDAVINQGNSGGPIFNRFGEVVGVNQSKLSGPTVEGTGYAIPSWLVINRLKAFESSRLVRSPLWGITLADMTDETFKSMGLEPRGFGSLVVKVKKGENSLGQRAGVHEGDILLRVDGYDVDFYGQVKVDGWRKPMSVYSYLSNCPLWSVVHFEVLRDGVLCECEVVVESPSRMPVDTLHVWIDPMPEYVVFGGIVMTDFSQNLLSELMMKGLIRGDAETLIALLKYRKNKFCSKPHVAISMILPESPAFKGSSRYIVKARDRIIAKINDQEVSTISDVIEALKKSISSDYLCIETLGGFKMGIPVQLSLEVDSILSGMYGYSQIEWDDQGGSDNQDEYDCQGESEEDLGMDCLEIADNN